MRAATFGLVVLSLFCGGCARTYRDTSMYQRTGQIKPIVSVMPVINSAGVCRAEWDYSRELTDEIRKRIFDSSKLYLLREGGSLDLAHELNTPNPTEIPCDLREQTAAAEYVVVAELMDQHETPYETASSKAHQEEAGAVLTMAVRLRVIDVRGATPKVILQEIVDHDHIIAKPYLKTDYTKATWGTEAYTSTPLGMAHSKVVRELVAHIESYITASH